MNTDKKEENSSISLDNIYKAIEYLKPEHQAVVLTNYKLPELYNIFVDDESYKKYINDLFAVATEYNNRAIALTALHTEAALQSMRKREVYDPATTMCQMFDCMSEADQKRFCEGMMKKKGFFEDACKMMIDCFEKAVEVKSDAVNGQVEK